MGGRINKRVGLKVGGWFYKCVGGWLRDISVRVQVSKTPTKKTLSKN